MNVAAGRMAQNVEVSQLVDETDQNCFSNALTCS